jgi:protein-S-isoprenylcysteine O-methyltransferase Ste14
MTNLNVRAWFGIAALAVVMACLLFVPAGTVRYWHAWTYLAIFFGASVLTTIDLMRRDPALLERRMKGGVTKEKRLTEKVIMAGTSLGFVAMLVVPGLDRRYGWSIVSAPIVVVGDVLIAVGFYFIFLVYRENTFTSATIEIMAGQKVISTGPYAMVRHPMYASASLYLLGTPLALGSYWGLVPVVAMLPLLIWRLLDEERMLSEGLPGYPDYQRTVRYRLVPGIW